MFQQSAKSVFTKNSTAGQFWRWPITTRRQMADSRMWSTSVVEIYILIYKVIKMLLAENAELIHALMLDRLNYVRHMHLDLEIGYED